MMDKVKKCNIIWGVCFSIMTLVAILFFALFMLKIRTTENEQLCEVLPDQDTCQGIAGQVLNCKWVGGQCRYP